MLTEKLSGDINSFEGYFDKYHEKAVLEEGTLKGSNGRIVEDDTEVVDLLGKDLGVVATIFKKEGDDFKRVTTSILDENGKRVTGTF